ncbi:hypothetical protein Scep_009732 [Stephania cephalantha]|uniref:Uncharacterized protein n=1 Tax=Stephania cephalantha TaxID=152367 RepID=A0AAP0PGJ4_9MAGN
MVATSVSETYQQAYHRALECELALRDEDEVQFRARSDRYSQGKRSFGSYQIGRGGNFKKHRFKGSASNHASSGGASRVPHTLADTTTHSRAPAPSSS